MNREGRYSTPIQGDAGYPDLTLVKDGRVLFLELKADGGRRSAAQNIWGEALTQAAAANGRVEYLTAYPDDLPALVALLGRRST